jgi:hypothetical protein
MREHTIKVTHCGLQALVNTLESEQLPSPHSKGIDKVLESLKVSLIIRFRKKLLVSQPTYKFKLPMHEALGLQEILGLCLTQGHFEYNEMNQLTARIDQYYA